MTTLLVFLCITCFILAYFAFANKETSVKQLVQKPSAVIKKEKIDISEKIILKNIAYIKMIKKENKLKQRDLASYGETSPATISRILNDYAKVPKTTVLRVTDKIIDNVN